MDAPASSMCSLEDTLGKLLLPSNDAIKEGTHQLQQLSKDPLFVAELVKVVSESQNPQVRQLAAVLLRRRIAKKWKTLKAEDQQQMKHHLLELIVKEPERIVQNSVGQIIATISKHEIPKSSWPELLQFLNNTLHSAVCLEREISSHVLSCVASSSAESLQPMFRDLFRLISNMLRDPESKFVPLNGIRTLTSLVVCIGTDEVNLFRQLIPPVIELMPQLLAWNEDYGCDAMELFDELLESEVSILAPYLKPLVQLSCEIASNSSFGDNARVKALSNLSSLMRLRKKAVIKNKLVAPLLKVIFPIMCENCDEEEDDDENDEIETQKPSLVAAQVVDVMALNFPPDKLLPHVLKFIQPALQSQNPSERKAGLLSLAVLAEGCADYIKQKHLKNFLMSICQNISHESTTVRHAALFALGQFSFHMQPDISKFHSELVPLLLNYLNQAVQNPQESKRKGLSRIYYALEMFCENLGKDLLPYLPALMKQLLETLQTASKLHHKELAVSAIGAVAVAVEEEFLPYFESTMAQMQTYLVSSPTPDHMTLQSQAIDTLGVLARSVGQRHFYPLAGDCVDYGLRLLNEADDPDLRRCIYGLFASLSTIMKEELTPHLPTLLKFMYSSLQSVEGVVAHYSEDSDQMAYLLDDMDGEEEDIQGADDSKDEDDDDDVEGYSIENAYLDEKEDACSALGEIAVNIGLGFAQFYEISTTEVLKLHQFSASSIRKASVITTGQLQCMMGKLVLSGEISVSKEEFVKSASDILMRLVEMIKDDEEKQVVMATLETFNDVLKMIGPLFASQDALLSSLMEAVKSVFQQKTACQGEDEDNDGGVDEDEEEQAEQDAMLMEYAGDLIPSMARTVGGAKFAPYLAGMLQLIFAKTKKASPVSDKSFATGVLSETVVAMETHIQAFIPHLLPVLMRLAGDEDDEVCNNSIFGLGVLVQYGGEQMHQHYPPLLQILSAILSQNRGEQVVDNVCAAVCRMVAANRDLVPIDQVLPALLNKLPLKKDVEENDTVYPCLAHLVQSGQQDALQNLPRILALFTQVLKYQTINEETRAALADTLRAACNSNDQHLSACIALLTPDLQEYLAGILNGAGTG
ncbi:Importin-4 [Holothuria leucospilota]|uniref:Importin-4 n=1 Tax=Holothuria leucospilota TaxID=206669 RepID=A0A9Q1HD19_HOLLE|nr:Importin-4 [Holothuria leucospilota]